ncbi:c-type cytochrome [Microbulbifer celer]|uniref:Di-heme-cytochrome C peroxidase n=1 Tax=Microbulbifer celer TaxID=435905 RepID=A0ABW3UFC1_9GAMM|nr:cytochrome c [Microbulbifer celer]UFN55838.1 cytochrome c [Microbulbifer celer]
MDLLRTLARALSRRANTPPVSRSRRKLRNRLIAGVLAGAATLGGFSLSKYFQSPNLVTEEITEVRYLDQGWTEEDRQRFYFTPQGTELQGLHYDWLTKLELPNSKTRLASENIMRGWGFIVDPEQQPSDSNPGNLPVGMGRHWNPDAGAFRLDLGCALCHTGELHYKGTALRVDGGQAIHGMSTSAAGEFITSLNVAAAETLANPAKWNRFADAIAGEDEDKRDQLQSELWQYLLRVVDFAQGPGNPDLITTTEGRGRTDAVGRIGNVVFGYNLGIKENYHTANAPVSYPFLWDIWRFDWVQYTGFTNQAMARNVGESLGVMAPVALVDENGNLLPEGEFGRSTINLEGMQCIETTLRKLRPPKWPQDVLGKIDIARATQGKALFAEQCASCHGPHISKPYQWPVADSPATRLPGQIDVNWQWDMSGQISYNAENRPQREDWRRSIWAVPWIDVATIGTDATAAENYVKNEYSAGPLLPEGADKVNAGHGLQLLINQLIPSLYQQRGISSDNNAIADYDGLNVPFRIVNKKAYKARPLHGVWATPPYLHNGSVPTIYDLLSPLAARPVRFGIGHREYNPIRLGYITDMREGNFVFDTTIKGNHNTGHLFTDADVSGRIGRRLTERERMALLEYLKVMGNPDFDQALGGDPQNWANYSTPPEGPLGEQACESLRSDDMQMAAQETSQ